MGSWLSYGLGSLNRDLPDFVVLSSAFWSGKVNVQALYHRLWGTGFLPTKHQGIAFQSVGDPVLFLSNPSGVDNKVRHKMLDFVARVNAGAGSGDGRSGDQDFHGPAGNGLPHADVGSELTDLRRRERGDPGTLRSRGEPNRFLCPELLIGPSHGGAGCAICPIVSPGLGSSPSVAHSPARPGPRRGPAHRRPSHGPETARFTRGYPGGFRR